ncbi:uncharacterized protein MONBRDRAFT_32707 [Monosiga brevicollis MX1]|uniref:Peptidase S9 prolyl oligopeptidase catalytic domain-containing protein n=1 Tax=Monosiga brevicollis TaxID=81824 RepID=A9V177_MONBE|nr:uncharacterized protein MONBRDRAFT_32707 [Monosiga brevicollis MX1]EDQ88882.1 predicted protein [Monosiga brevicollis MX1]|eukprot:XP_001746495.1 hypothetical protein [Monosiga brevicollis MX1]
MSLRASATCDAFKCAVAMYGFVFGRYMSLEGGDFTWELEYSGDLSWPLQERHTHSDVFPLLHKIKTPTLLLHGKEDDICMVSNSIVAHRQLRLQRTPTELVVYPGEGHGFTQPQHRRDRDERTLAWFLRYLPPTSQGKVLKL